MAIQRDARHSPSVDPEGGFALLVVLILLLLMIVLVGDLVFSAQMDLRRARLESAVAQADAAAEGALERTKLLLALDGRQSGPDGLHDVWNAPSERHYRLGEAQITVEVVDENRKFNVYQLEGGTAADHRAAVDRFVRVLVASREDSSFPIGYGEGMRIARGVEAYLRKRATLCGGDPRIPLPPIQKRRLVGPWELALEAIPTEIFYPQEREGETLPGLERYLTVWGNAQVNLNTVEEKVLQAYFRTTERGWSRRILSAREKLRRPPGVPGGREGYWGFLSVDDLGREHLLPADRLAALRHFFSVESDLFSILVRAEVASVRRTHRTLVHRARNGLRHLFHEIRDDSGGPSSSR